MTKLSSDLVVQTAIAVADGIGIERLTIRRLAESLGSKPMSIYHHIENKETLIDRMIDAVVGEIDLPGPNDDWRKGMEKRCRSARMVLRQHPWATALIDARVEPGPLHLHHHESVLACMRRANFTVELTSHAMVLLDSFVYGFALQEAALPATNADEIRELATDSMKDMDTDKYPFLVEFATQRVLESSYEFGDEFEYGLQLLLDALQDRLQNSRPSRAKNERKD